MYFPFFKPQTGGKRSAIQPQTIYSEFPLYSKYGIHREDWQAVIHDSGTDVSYIIANNSTL